jgi:hypothetical protein
LGKPLIKGSRSTIQLVYGLSQVRTIWCMSERG